VKSLQIKIGKGRKALTIEAAKLITRCALVQGGRDSGKSYLVRVIVEQTIQGGLQTIVLDPEGEFATLREKCSVLIVGDDGDLPVRISKGKRLAHRIAGAGVSTVVDLSSLKPQDRYEFVRVFLDAFDQLPKKLQKRPRLFVVDEAHLYCPESGKGKAVCAESVVTLLSQGRKRGHGTILVTQRLSKLRKDAANECGTLFIGRTAASDLSRAQDELGITKAEREALRDLPTGTFWAGGSGVGPSRQVEIRRALTSHPSPGEFYRHQTPPAPKEITKLLADFADAEPEVDPEPPSSAAAPERHSREAQRKLDALRNRERDLQHQLEVRDAEILGLQAHVGRLTRVIEEARSALTVPPAHRLATPRPSRARPSAPRKPRPAPPDQVAQRKPAHSTGLAFSWSSAPGKLLTVAIQHHPQLLTRKRAAALAGIRSRSSTLRNAMTSLRKSRLIDERGNAFAVYDWVADEHRDHVPALPSGQDLIDQWRGRLGGAPLAIFDALLDTGVGRGHRAEICAVAQVDPNRSTARNAYTKLRALGLIESNTGKMLVLAPHVMEAL